MRALKLYEASPKSCRQSTLWQTEFRGAAKLFRSHEDFQNLSSQGLKAQYNEMLYIANKKHMLFKGKLMLSFYKQHISDHF